MPIAPRGAVIRIASTATESTIFPQGRPRDIGTEPIAACTVAFGIYAVTQKSYSLRVSFVPRRHIHTPTALKISAPKIRSTAATPAVRV